MQLINSLKLEQPTKILNILYQLQFNQIEFDINCLYDNLIKSLSYQDDLSKMNPYNLTELLKFLQISDIEKDKIIEIEFKYFAYIDNPKYLMRYISENPQYFYDLISILYKSEKPSTKQNKNINSSNCSHVYKILNSWKIPPGLKENGEFDFTIFSNWVDKVRGICEKKR